MGAGVTGSNGRPFDRKEVGIFLLYVLIIAACVVILFYILFHARPSEEPEIKNTGARSMLLPQAVPATFLPVVSTESHFVSIRVSQARVS